MSQKRHKSTRSHKFKLMPSNCETPLSSRSIKFVEIEKAEIGKNILSREEESVLIAFLFELIVAEKDVEVKKINLALRADFNLIDAFSFIDKNVKS